MLFGASLGTLASVAAVSHDATAAMAAAAAAAATTTAPGGLGLGGAMNPSGMTMAGRTTMAVMPGVLLTFEGGKERFLLATSSDDQRHLVEGFSLQLGTVLV